MHRLLRLMVPEFVLAARRRWLGHLAMRRSRGKQPSEIFSDIYLQNKWGRGDGEFFSGTGSLPNMTDGYTAFVNKFVKDNGVTSIVDLGCGDFQVGQKIATEGHKYIGCDVVPELVEYNSRKFGNENVSFRLCNIVDDPLPNADLCLIRQVLQHLSNSDIKAVISKLNQYRFILITDAQMWGVPSENIDIETFSGTRNDFGHGLFLESPPFDLEVKTVMESKATHKDGYYHRTVLLELNPNDSVIT
jgi:SAM-dependent methyltransferase